MKSEEIKQKRFRNEEEQDELITITRELERQQADCEQLLYRERQLNEEVMNDFHDTAFGYKWSDFMDADRQSEYQFMGIFEEMRETCYKKRIALEEENESLYQAELNIWKEEEETDGQS